MITLLVLAACASQQPPPTEAVRARLGTVAVQAVPATPKTDLAKPATRGQGAASGALKGMAFFGLEGASEGGPYALPIAVAMMPIGALTGAVVGGMSGTPKKETAAAEIALRRVLAESDLQETVRREVAAAVRNDTRHPVATAGKSGSGNLEAANSVLEVNVLEAGLTGSNEKNAMLSLFLKVRVRLLSMPDGAVLYQDTWRQTRNYLTFNQWGEQDARLFQKELVIASQVVADRIVRHVLLAEPQGPEPPLSVPLPRSRPQPEPTRKGGLRAPYRRDESHWRDDGTSSIRHRNWQTPWHPTR